VRSPTFWLLDSATIGGNRIRTSAGRFESVYPQNVKDILRMLTAQPRPSGHHVLGIATGYG
jgi:hypothetical protein